MKDFSNSEFIKYRHFLGFQRSPHYLKYMKKKFPALDLHHILGSSLGKKYTDYLIIPIEHSFHINTVTGNEGKYFYAFLNSSINHLKQYAFDTHKLRLNIIPNSIKSLMENINIIHELDLKLDKLDKKGEK